MLLCNIVNYKHAVLICRKDAENAMNMLNATVIGKQTVRLSWGRSQGNKQVIPRVKYPLPIKDCRISPAYSLYHEWKCHYHRNLSHIFSPMVEVCQFSTRVVGLAVRHLDSGLEPCTMVPT